MFAATGAVKFLHIATEEWLETKVGADIFPPVKVTNDSDILRGGNALTMAEVTTPKVPILQVRLWSPSDLYQIST
jgi:hypothetical protein